MFEITTFSLIVNSSISFLNHVIFVGTGFEINLQLKSASCPSFMLTFSNLAANFGKSLN